MEEKYLRFMDLHDISENDKSRKLNSYSKRPFPRKINVGRQSCTIDREKIVNLERKIKKQEIGKELLDRVIISGLSLCSKYESSHQ